MSESDIEQLELSFALSLSTGDGRGLELHQVLLEKRGREVSLDGQLAGADWPRVVDEQAFGLSAEVLPSGGLDFVDVGRHVELKLRLSGGLPEGTDLAAFATCLRASDDFGCDQDDWLLCEAYQDVDLPEDVEGSAKAGFKTSWADEGGAEVSELERLTESWLRDAGAEVQGLQPGLMKVPMEVEGHEWVLLVRIDAEAGIVGFYSIYPELVPEEARYALALLLMGQNFDLPFGAFEMDPEDGETRLRTAWAGGPGELPSGAQLYELVAPHAPVMAAHMDVIRGLIADVLAEESESAD